MDCTVIRSVWCLAISSSAARPSKRGTAVLCCCCGCLSVKLQNHRDKSGTALHIKHLWKQRQSGVERQHETQEDDTTTRHTTDTHARTVSARCCTSSVAWLQKNTTTSGKESVLRLQLESSRHSLIIVTRRYYCKDVECKYACRNCPYMSRRSGIN